MTLIPPDFLVDENAILNVFDSHQGRNTFYISLIELKNNVITFFQYGIRYELRGIIEEIHINQDEEIPVYNVHGGVFQLYSIKVS